MKKASIAAVCGLMLAGPAAADTLNLTGVVRDFKRGDWNGGHPDFQTASSMGGFGHVRGLVTMDLTDDGKPEYNSSRPNKDTITSAATLAQWYKDVPDVNLSEAMTLTLSNGQDEPGGVYSFSSNSFWPIDNKMYGNQGLNKNFHFTYELHTKFSYVPGQYFTFIGDDDVWVYVDGKKVIDLGGVHPAVTGSVLLLDGKAFVEKSDFSSSNADVQVVSSSMVGALATKWCELGLPGSCPITDGDKYVDLDLTEGLPDTRAEFSDDKTSVAVYATQSLDEVILVFVDGLTERFDSVSGKSAEVAGTGANEGKALLGAYIKTTSHSGNGAYQPATGGSAIEADLDFFFAERHTTQSNFRIDTSMNLVAEPPTTISPLYD